MSDIAKIPLTRGQFALIDAEDFLKVMAVSKHWQAGLAGRNRKRFVPQTKVQGDDKKVPVFLSRVIMDAAPGTIVDHINHDTLDNRKCNLRIATPSQNCMNQRKQARQTSSRFKGVCLFKRLNLWLAYIKTNGKRTYLGYFKDEIDAARAYDLAARKQHGEFACLNFPGTN